MDVAHEHRHGLVAHQLHAYLGWRARIGNVGYRAVADAVRPNVRYAGSLEYARPAAVVLTVG